MDKAITVGEVTTVIGIGLAAVVVVSLFIGFLWILAQQFRH